MLYSSTIPPSLESRLIQFFMGLFGMKRAMERKILRNRYNKEPAAIPKSIVKNFNFKVEEYSGRKVWSISPKRQESNTIILFLHGGAYYANITKMHWGFIEQILINTNATFIVPDYPLAPESTCIDTYLFLDEVYASLIANHPLKKIVFMGDSAGGGLALGFAMQVRDESIKRPEKIILLSPWLDVSMGNPEITKYDKFDKILSLNGLKIAGKNYAGDLEVTDFRVSPIYGDFSNLGEISIFIGTNDMLIADCRKCKKIMKDRKIYFNYFEYPKMFHDWVIVSTLNESMNVVNTVNNLILQNEIVSDKVE